MKKSIIYISTAIIMTLLLITLTACIGIEQQPTVDYTIDYTVVKMYQGSSKDGKTQTYFIVVEPNLTDEQIQERGLQKRYYFMTKDFEEYSKYEVGDAWKPSNGWTITNIDEFM